MRFPGLPQLNIWVALKGTLGADERSQMITVSPLGGSSQPHWGFKCGVSWTNVPWEHHSQEIMERNMVGRGQCGRWSVHEGWLQGLVTLCEET